MLRRSSICVLVLAIAAGPAWADNEHHGKPEKHGRDDRTKERVEVRFGESQHAAVHGWYEKEIKGGHCPPGLAKKHNGCMPPGLAKKRWAIGRPLPREVVFYDLPPPLVVELGPPPAGYRYARVANDVLLLAVGTGMVVDAITDLGRM
jgi:Ni/Co efflux regulator RcnB